MKYLMVFLLAFAIAGCFKNAEKEEVYTPDKSGCKEDSCNVRFRLEKYTCRLLVETKSGNMLWYTGIFDDRFRGTVKDVHLFLGPRFIIFTFPETTQYKTFHFEISNQCAKDLYNIVFEKSKKQISKQIEDQTVNEFLNSIGG